ncbi:hypothetical protein [Sphingobium bisphenolivorans]|uniref:hypothetical protein n=1 Tax=Sphingobium bisphenolivorans TaxID=1335760 RepID=UPI0003A0DBCA|nr:hypothetical protein [Sphingobium bisphenolivorans]
MVGKARFTPEEQREKARVYAARYHAENRENCLAKMRERNARYYERNKERLKAAALKYQGENGEKRNRYKADWNKRKKESCPQFAAQTMMRKLLARTCERIKMSRRQIGKTIDALGYTADEFRAHIEAQFQDGMTWGNHGQWHVDHIHPLSKFDLTDPEQRREANALANLQPLWAAENMSKGARTT